MSAARLHGITGRNRLIACRSRGLGESSDNRGTAASVGLAVAQEACAAYAAYVQYTLVSTRRALGLANVIVGVGSMTERLKFRDKVTGEEEGPFWGTFEAKTWIKLITNPEYDVISSSDCCDRHGNEIFEADMVSYMDMWPVQIVEANGPVGYFEDGKLVEVTPGWSAYAEIVGRNGALCNW